MSDFMHSLPSLNEVFQLLNWPQLHEIFGTIAAGLTTISILFGLSQWFKRLGLQGKLTEAQKTIEMLKRDTNTLDANIWELHHNPTPNWYYQKWLSSKLRVLLLANLKGGVGKSTMAANLAISLARRGYRVLIIDFDYQGSLDIRFQVIGKSDTDIGGANALLMEDGQLFHKDTTYELTGKNEGITLVPSFFSFAKLENQLMSQWVLQDKTEDVRFRLAKKLVDPKVSEKFDIVIIDTPPRLTTGIVNALCASTDILIPTIVDPTSIEAVLGFVTTVEWFKHRYNSKLKILGVIPSMTWRSKLRDDEKQMLQGLNRELAPKEVKVLPLNIPRKALASVINGRKALYDADEDCKNVFDKLANSLHLGPPKSGPSKSASQPKETTHESLGISVSA